VLEWSYQSIDSKCNYSEWGIKFDYYGQSGCSIDKEAQFKAFPFSHHSSANDITHNTETNNEAYTSTGYSSTNAIANITKTNPFSRNNEANLPTSYSISNQCIDKQALGHGIFCPIIVVEPFIVETYSIANHATLKQPN
jgi:hypothetical protein